MRTNFSTFLTAALLQVLALRPALAAFEPPPVWQNEMLVHSINAVKTYTRETINVVASNVSPEPQTKYYLPFPSDLFHTVAGLEAKSKADPAVPFRTRRLPSDGEGEYQFFEVDLAEVEPAGKLTFSLSYSLLNSTVPLPARISQDETQFLQHSFSAHHLSPYPTARQKTKVRVPSMAGITYTSLHRPASKNDEAGTDPSTEGSDLTYGPYDAVEPYSTRPVSVRYQLTAPVLHASRLERDITVSHWGGNVAVEERYWVENHGAGLSQPFRRAQFSMDEARKRPSAAVKTLRFPIAGRAEDGYVVDQVGKVWTSRFQSAKRDSVLEFRPRYPIFGEWKYSFKIGWNMGLAQVLNKAARAADTYVLSVPFVEGPRVANGVQYGDVEVRIILPEGATDIDFKTDFPISSHSFETAKAYLDTVARPVLVLRASGFTDESRASASATGRDARPQLLVSYRYTWAAHMRKPVVVVAGALAVPLIVILVIRRLGRSSAEVEAGSGTGKGKGKGKENENGAAVKEEREEKGKR